MKPKTLATLLMFISSFLFAFTEHSKTTFSKYIHFSTPSVQLGELLQNKTTPFTITYTNISKEYIPLEFKSSCGCTVVHASQTSLAPGQFGQLTGRFYSKLYEGPITKYVYIISNPKFTYKFPIRATVYPDFTLSQKTIFIPSLRKHKGSIKVTLSSKKFSNFRIQQIHYNKNFCHIKYKRIKDKYIITLSILHQTSNFFKERILIKTLPESKKEIILNVQGYK